MTKTEIKSNQKRQSAQKEAGLNLLRMKSYQAKLKAHLEKQKQRRIAESLERYDHPDNLPAERFFKILESNDLRYLLKVKKLPEYTPADLEFIWENIIKEYERITKDNSFTNRLQDLLDDAREINSLIRLRALFSLMRMGEESILEDLKEYGFNFSVINPDNTNKVRNKILREITKLEVQFMRNKAENDSQEPFNFLKVLQQLSNVFHRNVDRNISLTEWIFLIREAKEYIKHGKVRRPKQGS